MELVQFSIHYGMHYLLPFLIAFIFFKKYFSGCKLVQFIEVDTEKVSMNLSELNTGLYIISIFNEEGVQTSKFIKE